MSDIQIVAIMLVKNEDIYVETSIRNIIGFCDRIIIADHQSTDRTCDICQRLAGEFPVIDHHSIEDTAESARLIESYAGTDTWIFGVDGDEIYDPQGLKVMKQKLTDGAFAKDWVVFGNVLNVMSLNQDGNPFTAKGHLAPPSRSVTKLYNFSAIENWKNCPERLHGEEIVFKPGFDASLRRYLHEEIPWDDSYFRCLHLAFLPRSSKKKNHWSQTRLNPDEVYQINSAQGWLQKASAALRLQLDLVLGRDWKNQKYRRGPLVEKDVSVFFS